MRVTSAMLATALAVGQASATWDSHASGFSAPSTCDNTCNSDQESGFDWGSLSTGSFSSYGGYSFSGFSCTDGGSKLLKRGFQSKAISGEVSNKSGPGMSCGDNENDFSIDELHISSDKDTDVECHYSMPDGSTCRQTSSCSTGGNIVKNNQCGGATAVTFQLPSTATSPCSVSVHSIGFNCGSATTSAGGHSSTGGASSSKPASSAVFTSSAVPSNSKPGHSGSASASHSAPESSSTPGSPVEQTSSKPAEHTSASFSAPSGSYSIPFGTGFSSYSKPSESAPASSESKPAESSSTPGSPVEQTSSKAVSFSVPTGTGFYPSSSIYYSPGVSSSTPGSPVTVSSSSPVSSSAVPTPECPGVLPKCLNTFLELKTSCKDNFDTECFCGIADFTESVQECVSAWGGSDEVVQEALSYLAGLCAAQIPKNPGLITNCPGSVTLGPSTTPASPVESSASSADVTTEVVYTTVTTCPAGQTITEGSSTTVLITPVVSTVTLTSTSTVCTKCTAAPSSPAAPVAGSSSPAGPVASSAASASSPAGPVTAPGTTAGSSPVTTPAATVPYTTVVISQTVTVPCTYTEGVSAGLTIPASSSTTVLQTSAVIPQVGFTSSVYTSAGVTTTSVGLAAGTPNSAPASSTGVAGPVAGSSAPGVFYTPGASAGFSTVSAPKPTNGTITGTASPSTFTGAAGKVSAGTVGSIAAGGLLAMFFL